MEQASENAFEKKKKKKKSSLCVFHFVLDSVSLMNGASARCRSALILYLTLSFNFCLTDWLLRFQCPCLCIFFLNLFFFFFSSSLRMFTLSCNQDTHKHWSSLKPKYLFVNLLHNSARSRTAVTQRTVRYDDYFIFIFSEAIFLFWLGGERGGRRSAPLLHWKKALLN